MAQEGASRNAHVIFIRGWNKWRWRPTPWPAKAGAANVSPESAAVSGVAAQEEQLVVMLPPAINGGPLTSRSMLRLRLLVCDKGIMRGVGPARVAKPPKVFISYSHDDPRHEERVLDLANRLRKDGVDAEIDQYEDAPAEGWPLWCERQINLADFVLMVCTETYLRRVRDKEEDCKGLGVLWEAQIIRNILYGSGSASSKFVPVLFSDGKDQHVPLIVSGFTRRGQVDTEDGYIALYRQLTNQPAVKRPPLGKQKPLAPKEPKPAAVEAARERLEVEVEAASTPLGELYLGSDTVRFERLVQRAPSRFRIFRDVDEPWCPEMVELPGGEFMMGSPDSDEQKSKHERYQHLVTVARSFAIGSYPVTFQEYDHFCAWTDRQKPQDWDFGRDRRPVIGVSWLGARAYVRWLSDVTGQSYRLPSEAEWEYACRAGTTTRYSVGDEITAKDANYGDNVSRTTEVGKYAPNPWGIFDMHGNVWEWVEDVWHDGYGTDAPADGSAWTDGEGDNSPLHRVIRGGSWTISPKFLRSAHRSGMAPHERVPDCGFRVALTLD